MQTPKLSWVNWIECLRYLGTKIWEMLQWDLKQTKSLSEFKAEIKSQPLKLFLLFERHACKGFFLFKLVV